MKKQISKGIKCMHWTHWHVRYLKKTWCDSLLCLKIYLPQVHPHLYRIYHPFFGMFTYIYHEKPTKNVILFQLSHRFHRRSRSAILHWSVPWSGFQRRNSPCFPMPFKSHPWTCRISLEGLKSSLCNKNGILPIGLNDSKGHHYLSPNVSNKNKFSNGSQYERKSIVHTFINSFLGILLTQNHQEFADHANTFWTNWRIQTCHASKSCPDRPMWSKHNERLVHTVLLLKHNRP